MVAPDEENPCIMSYLSQKYNCKSFYGFVRDEYSVGCVAPCSFMLQANNLRIDVDSNAIYLTEFIKIDLSTYEKRVSLQHDLRQKAQTLKKHLLELKSYIKQNITLEELL
ncbi:MAG: hypothetical protein ACQESN_10640 [Thermotogota bacterium]